MTLPFDRGHWEEVTDRNLSLYFLRGRTVIRRNGPDLSQIYCTDAIESGTESSPPTVPSQAVIRKAVKTRFLKTSHN